MEDEACRFRLKTHRAPVAATDPLY